MKQNTLGLLVIACSLALAVTASAQPARTPPIESPVVHADRTITFRFKAPKARQVELSGPSTNKPPHSMTT